MIATWFLQASSSRIALGPIDLTIIAVYFVLVLRLGFYLKKFTKTRACVRPEWYLIS